MAIYALFLFNCRKSLVRAFRKKTPLSVRRTWGGGARGGRKGSLRQFQLLQLLLQAVFNSYPNMRSVKKPCSVRCRCIALTLQQVWEFLYNLANQKSFTIQKKYLFWTFFIFYILKHFPFAHGHPICWNLQVKSAVSAYMKDQQQHIH